MHNQISLTKILQSLCVATVLMASSAVAQSSASGTLSLSAKVVTPLALTVTHSLDFGTIFSGTASVVAPSDPGAGRAEISGQAGANIMVTLTMPNSMTLDGTSTTIPVNGWVYATNSQATLTSMAVSSFSGGVAFPIALTFPAGSGSARIYMGIGAAAVASASQAPGNYSATGQITVAYADL